MKLGLATPFWPPFYKIAIKRSGWEGQAGGSRPRWHGRQTDARQRSVTLPYIAVTQFWKLEKRGQSARVIRKRKHGKNNDTFIKMSQRVGDRRVGFRWELVFCRFHRNSGGIARGFTGRGEKGCNPRRYLSYSFCNPSRSSARQKTRV